MSLTNKSFLGVVLISALGYYYRNWTSLAYVVSMFGLPPFLMFLLLPESPWWLHSQGKINEANAVIKSIVEGEKVDEFQ